MQCVYLNVCLSALYLNQVLFQGQQTEMLFCVNVLAYLYGYTAHKQFSWGLYSCVISKFGKTR